nr:fasciclin domain-containing protein [uncultured Sphingomonas sp.]
MRTPTFFAALAGIALAAAPAAAHNHSQNAPGRTVVEVAVGNSDFSTLVTAVQAADLATTLSGRGPFTVFAPTNAAFAKLPAGTVETLVQPANKATLTSVLTYHVVPGRVNAAQLTKLIRDGGGTATLTTVQGGTLKASLMGDRIMLTDAKGGMAHVVTANVNASNGVIHAIDSVVMP